MTPETILEHDGISQPILEWALDFGITPNVIIARLNRGMSIPDAITIPMVVAHSGQRLPIFSSEQVPRNMRRDYFTVRGETKSLMEWAKHVGITRTALLARVRVMSIEAALALGAEEHPTTDTPGVVSNFPPSEGTGAGSTSQETPNLSFSQEAAE